MGLCMSIKKLTIKGETTECAIREGLRKIGLAQERTLIHLLQKESQNIFGHRDALVSITYSEEESEASLKKKSMTALSSKCYLALSKGQASLQVPAFFYKNQYLPVYEDKVAFLKSFLEERGIVDGLNEENIDEIAKDPESQYSQINIKTFDTTPVNETGVEIYLKMSEDEMRCQAIIFFGEDSLVTEEEIYEILRKNRIVKGILKKNIQRVIETKYCNFFDIARGKLAQDDLSGEVEKFFCEDEKREFAKMMEALTIDTRNVKDINITEEHQILIRIGDIISGEDGFTTKGKTLEKKDLIEGEISISLGPNVYISDDKKEIFSKISGHIVWDKEKEFIDVEPIYIVDGCVDFSEGNIVNFVGKVLIKGDVKAKFSVTAHKDIEIHGSVEDAEVRSFDGSVMVLGSVVHKLQGSIQAKEKIICSIATNANLKARDITIEKESMNSILQASDSITATGNPGVILGGETRAKYKIKANTIGSESWVPTKIHVGDVKDLKKKLRALQQNLITDTGKLKESKQVVEILEQRKKVGPLNNGQIVQLKKSLDVIPILEEKVAFVNEDEALLKKEIQERKDAKLEILKTLHPQVDIYIFEGYFIPNSAESLTGFYCSNGDIKRLALLIKYS